MAALTWRNVDAPDFRSSIEGYSTFSRLLDNAFKGASQGLDTFDAAQDEKANNAVIAAAMRERDPEAYEAALKAGTFLSGVDPSRINTQTYGVLNSQASSLLDQVARREALGDTRYNRGQIRAADALAPQVLGATDARFNDKPNLETEAAIRAASGNIGIKNAMDITRALQEAQSKGIGLTGERQDQKIQLSEEGRAAGRFGREQTIWGREDQDYNDRQVATNAAAIAMRSGGSAEDVRATLAGMNLSGSQLKYALSELDPRFGSIYGADRAASVGASTGGSSNPWDVVLGNGKYGSPNKPVSSMTMGEVYDFGRNTLIPNTKAAGIGRGANGEILGSSAVGTYQIVGSTLRDVAPKVLGKDWASKPFSAQNQDKIAEYIFNNSRGSAQALKGQWESLSLRDAEAIRKLPWTEARKVIARGESSASGSAFDILNAGTAARTGVQQRLAQNERGTTIPDWSRAINDRSTSREVASVLATGPLKGVENPDQLAYRIEGIMKKSGVNAAEAGEIIRQSVVTAPQSKGLWGDLRDMFRLKDGSLPDNLKPTVDQRRIDTLSQSAGDGTTRSQVLESERLRQIDGQIGVAQNNVARANAALAAAARRAQVDPAAALNLDKYRADARNAEAQLQGLLRQSVSPSAKPRTPTRKEAPNRRTIVDWLGLYAGKPGG